MKTVDKGLMMKGGEPGMKIHKRLLAMLMALVMLTSMLHVGAFAENDAPATGTGIAVENPDGNKKEPAREGTGGSKDQGGGGKTAEGALTSEPNAAPAKKSEAPSGGWVDPPSPEPTTPTQGSNTGGTKEDVGSGPSGETGEGGSGSGYPEGYVPGGSGAGVPEGNGNGNTGNGNVVDPGDAIGNNQPGVMPYARFGNITLDCGEGGSVTDLSKTARAGSLVRFKTVPETDYSLDSVSVRGVGGSEVAVSSSGGSHEFTMPASGEDVTVTVRFKTATPSSGEGGLPGEGVPSGVWAVTLNVTGQGQMRIVDSKGDNTNKTSFATGETVYLKLTVDLGFELKRLAMNGTALTAHRYDPMPGSVHDNTVSYDARFTMPDGAVTVEAVFGGEGEVVIPGTPGSATTPGGLPTHGENGNQPTASPPYTITLDANGGKVKSQESIQLTTEADGTLASLPGAIPPKLYMYFRGWSHPELGSIIEGKTVFTGDTTITAVYEKAVIITFDANGGTVYGQATVQLPADSNGEFTTPPTPVPPEGMVFVGWFNENMMWLLKWTQDTTVYAQYRPAPPYTITLSADGMEIDGTTVQTDENGRIQGDLPVLRNLSLRQRWRGWFMGIDKDQQVQTGPNGTLFTRDTTIYAKWTDGTPLTHESYTITLDARTNGGSIDGAETVTFQTDPLSGTLHYLYQLPTPVHSSLPVFSFRGWYTSPGGPGGGTKVTESTRFDADTTVYACWSDDPFVSWTYTVTFDATGGKVNGKETDTAATLENGKLVYLPTPTHDNTNMQFLGWFTSATGGIKVTERVTVFPSDDTIYAHWQDNTPAPCIHTVTYAIEGGSFAEGTETTENVTDGQSPANVPTGMTPDNDHKATGAWYLGDGDTPVDPAAVSITGPTTFTYKFDAKPTCTVSVNASPAEGGSVTGGGNYTENESVTVNITDIVEGYVFVGWYKDGVRVSTARNYTFTCSEDVALIARFIEITKIIYSLSPSSVAGVDGESFMIKVTLTGAQGSSLPATEYAKLTLRRDGSDVGQYIASEKAFMIEASDLGVGEHVLRLEYPGSDEYLHRSSVVPVKVVKKQALRLVDFAPASVPLNTGYTITGRILDENDLPVKDKELLIFVPDDERSPTGYSLDATTDGDGNFSVSVEKYLPTSEGKRTIYVSCSADDSYKSLRASHDISFGDVSPYTYTVTFNIVNGVWNDDTTQKAVMLARNSMIQATDVPALRPDVGYGVGAWDVNPVGKTVTGNATYTWTYFHYTINYNTGGKGAAPAPTQSVNSGSSGSGSPDVEWYGSAAEQSMLSGDDLYRVYDKEGRIWFTDPDDDSTAVKSDTPIGADTTLYCKWVQGDKIVDAVSLSVFPKAGDSIPQGHWYPGGEWGELSAQFVRANGTDYEIGAVNWDNPDGDGTFVEGKTYEVRIGVTTGDPDTSKTFLKGHATAKLDSGHAITNPEVCYALSVDGAASAKIDYVQPTDSFVTIQYTVPVATANKTDAGVSVTDMTLTCLDKSPLNASVTNPGENGRWTYISDPAAVAVVENGLVIAVSVGTATITARYESDTTVGEATVTVTVNPKTITEADFTTLPTETKVYNGMSQTQEIASSTLTEGTDYEVVYTANTNAGTAGYTVKGKGNYTGAIERTFTIQPLDASGFRIFIEPNAVAYNGRPWTVVAAMANLEENKISAAVARHPASRPLDPQTDFTLSWSDSTDAGTVTVTATMKGNYTGSVTGTFRIEPAQVTITGLSAESKSYDSNKTTTPTGTAAVNGALDGDDVRVKAGEAAFADEYAGTGKTVTFSGYSLEGADAGNYTLEKQPDSVTADITPADQTPSITAAAALVKGGNTLDLATLVSGAQGDVSFSIESGTAATLESDGKTLKSGDFTGDVVINVNITAKDLGGDSTPEYNAYTGDGAITVTVVDKKAAGITVNNSDITLPYGDEYTIAVTTDPKGLDVTFIPKDDGVVSVDENGVVTALKPGVTTVTVRCDDGIHFGETTVMVTVVPRPISEAFFTALPTETKVYNGMPQTQEIASSTLTEGTDYEVVYTANTNAGTAGYIVKGKGNYTGTIERTFTIEKAQARAYPEPVEYRGFYDGKPHALLESPGTAIGGKLQYKLQDEDDTKWSENIPVATDAGSYYVQYRVVGDENHKDYTSGIVNAAIRKAPIDAATITPPAARTLRYTGAEQELVTPGACPYGELRYCPKTDGTIEPDITKWTTTPPKATEVGTYTVRWVVYGDQNHDIYSATAPVTVEIGKGLLTLGLSIEGWAEGEAAKSPVLTGNTGNGAVTYEYKPATADESAYGTTVPTAAGDYTVRATVAETANYEGGATAAEFTVSPAPPAPVTVTGITLNSDSAKKVYTEGEALDVTGLTLEVSKSDGSKSTVDVTAAMISGFDSSKTGTQTLTVTYEGFTDTYEVEVTAKQNPTPTPTPTPTPKAKPASMARPEANHCGFELTGIGTGVAEYAQQRCAAHQAVADQAKALLEKATASEETLEAWRAAKALWQEALGKEYSAFLAAADEATRPLIEAEREAFFEQLAAHEAMLALLHPDDPALAARRVTEALERRVAELCFARHHGRPLTFDEAGAEELPDAEACERCHRVEESEAEGDGDTLREILCETHRALEWVEWLEALQEQMRGRIPEGNAEAEAAIQADLTAFEEWLAARKALVEALHPQAPDLADEVLALAARARALELCEDSE